MLWNQFVSISHQHISSPHAFSSLRPLKSLLFKGSSRHVSVRSKIDLWKFVILIFRGIMSSRELTIRQKNRWKEDCSFYFFLLRNIWFKTIWVCILENILDFSLSFLCLYISYEGLCFLCHSLSSHPITRFVLSMNLQQLFNMHYYYYSI